MRTALSAILFLSACSFGPVTDDFTWGDASLSISEAYCTRSEECGWLTGTDACVAHSVFHLCELEETCLISLPDGSEEIVTACSEAMAGFDCFLIGFGFTPEECGPVFDLRPMTSEG